MKRIQHDDYLEVFYDPEYEVYAQGITEYYENALSLLNEKWGVKGTDFVKVYICKDPVDFIFGIAKGFKKFVWQMSYPLWSGRVKRFYNRAGGMTLQMYGGAFIWLRPPDAYAYVDRTVGNLLFGKIDDPIEKLQFVFVHELTHAYIGNRRLEAWLNEGLAMTTVDDYFRKCTVLEDVLEKFVKDHRNYTLISYNRMAGAKAENIAFTYAFGYWATRYIEAVYPDLIRNALAKDLKKDRFIRFIYDQMGTETVGGQFGDRIYKYYQKD